MTRSKIIILLTVFIDVLGVGIVIPILPFYVESFGGSAFTVTLLIAVYSLFSFLSSPLLGALSDRIGRRPVLLISIFSTAIGWLVFAGAKNLFWLFTGRIIDGLAAGNLQTTQSYLIDISKDEKDRSANLGLIGMIFGIGFIIGPALGGYLAQVSHSFPFWFVGALALLNTFSAYWFLPESNKHLKRDSKMSFNPFAPLARAVKNNKMLPAYTIWLLFMIGTSIAQSIFTLFINKKFGFEELTAGTFMALVGIIVAINQGFALKKIWLKFFKQHHLAVYVLLISGFGHLLYSVGNIYIFCAGLVITSFTQSILRVVLTSQTIGLAGLQERGEVMGVLGSIASLGLMIGPPLGGAVFGININYPIYIAVLLFIIAFFLAKQRQKDLERSALPLAGDVTQV